MKQTLLIALLIYSTAIFSGGPWLAKAKSGFFELQTTQPISTYNQLFLENGATLNLNRSTLDRTYQVYLEYGLTDKLNLITSLPIKAISTHEKQTTLGSPYTLDEGNLIGLGNYKLAIKHKLTEGKIISAISIQANFNTISKDLNKGLATGYDANYIGLYAHLGKSLSNKTYTFIDFGYNKTNGNYSDYIDIHYELGHKFKDNFTGAFTFDIRESMKNGSYNNPNLQQTGFYTNNQEYVAFGIKAAYQFKNNLGITVAPFGGLSGNYVAKVFTFSVGVYKKW